MKAGRIWTRWAGVALALLPGAAGMAAEAAAGGGAVEPAYAMRTLALVVAAAATVSVSVLGAAYAVARVGSAALGAAAEKPELLTRSILFVALAEGLAVLGFAIAMMMLQKV